jgi:hypothetical protein
MISCLAIHLVDAERRWTTSWCAREEGGDVEEGEYDKVVLILSRSGKRGWAKGSMVQYVGYGMVYE